MKNYEALLLDFLNAPLENGDQVFERFAALPNAVVGKGEKPLHRYVYVPGNRSDRVVLVAHIDTVWDESYGVFFPREREIKFSNGVFFSGTPGVGIGADDRAGCAMLWELRDSGHSLLLVDGEEHGKQGATFLKETNGPLFCELNRHCYMIEFDWRHKDFCLFEQVDNTRKFKKYIQKSLKLKADTLKGGTDLQMLCKDICGVNISVGYYAYHNEREMLVLSEWKYMLDKVNEFLQQPQERFCCSSFAPFVKFVRRQGGRVLRAVKIIK